jgi:hypothetical protein
MAGPIGRGVGMQQALFGSWARQSHFGGLAPLHDLNHRFLDLVGARTGDWRAPHNLRLPGEASIQVTPLTAAQRAAAASCPYALFDLRFQDDEYWRSRLESAGQWRIADETAVPSDTASFVRLALFYAWHVASSTRLAAQLLLGMNEHTAAAFRAVTLNCLPALASSESANLTPRWSQSDVYWRALMDAASLKDAARLRRIQLFGLQLAAAARLP